MVPKPGLLRKSALHLRSQPTDGSRYDRRRLMRHVQFAPSLEDVHYFDAHDEAKSGISCRTIQFMNFSSADLTDLEQPVQLKELHLSLDGSEILGTVKVKNLALEKIVAVRFTTDQWYTISEVFAKYHLSDDCPPGYDQFRFTINLDVPEASSLFLCVRYRVHDDEFWDNNQSLNYHVNVSPLQHKGMNHPYQKLSAILSNPLSWKAETTVGRDVATPISTPLAYLEEATPKHGQLSLQQSLASRCHWEQSFTKLENRTRQKLSLN